MTLLDRIISLTTLLSLFVVGPPLGRSLSLWWDQKRSRPLYSEHIVLAISTMIVMTTLATAYGELWKLNPRMVAWYAWIDFALPINGEVEVSNDPLAVRVDNEPLDVTISR